VAVESSRADAVDQLSSEELDALIGAATWYAKYHEPMIANLADDPSALAITRRERFQALYGALSKFGVRLRRPHGISAPTPG
jgi:hypothetical protein